MHIFRSFSSNNQKEESIALRSLGHVSSSRELWVENAHVSYGSPLSSPHDYMGSSFSRLMFIVCMSIVIGFGIFLFFRVAWLQIAGGKQYAFIAENNRTRHIAVPAERGLILDRHGKALVRNTPRFALHVNPAYIPKNEDEHRTLARLIADILERDHFEVSALLASLSTSINGDVLLYDTITHEQAIMFSVAGAQYPALQVASGVQRSYLANEGINSLSHIIGYEGKISPEELNDHQHEGYVQTDYIGKQGVEFAYESYLRGEKGDRVMEVNARGSQLFLLSEMVPKNGEHIQLTIDAQLQIIAHDALRDIMNKNGKSRGVVIVQSTQSGELLAVVSEPGYDNEQFAQGLSPDVYKQIIEDKDQPLINRAFSGLYPSGSTIKPIMAVAGLAEGVIRPETTVLSTGGIALGNWFFPDWKAGGHGRTNVRKAIAESVNTFFYLLGGGDGNDHEGLGIERINTWLLRFGFGEKTGVDIGFEQKGLVPNPSWKEKQKNEQWYIGDTYNVSIGQGDLLITPLQLTNAISAVANGGSLMIPSIVNKVGDRVLPQLIARKIDAPEYAFSEAQAGMRDAVLYGSARSMANMDLAVAGKTGTAQWSSIHPPHAWFVGFAPYQKPEITVTVLIEEGEEGSRLATPVAKKIFEWWELHRYPL